MLSEADYGFRGPGGGMGSSCATSHYLHAQAGTAISPTAVPDLPLPMRASSEGLTLPGPMLAAPAPASTSPPAVVAGETLRSSSGGNGLPSGQTASASPAPAPTAADTQGSSSTGGATLPSRGSQVNLEEMIGSSLAFAINSLEHTSQTGQLSGWGSTDSSSGGTVSPVDSARSPSLEDTTPDPATFQLYQHLLAQQAQQLAAVQHAGASTPVQHPGGKPSGPRIRIPVVQGAPPPPHPPPPHSYAQPTAQHNPALSAPMLSPATSYVTTAGPMPVVPDDPLKCPTSPHSYVASSPRATGPTGGGVSGSRATLFETSAGIEMVQFLLETESRALMIFNVEAVPSEILLMACEKLGSLAYLRTEFRASRGIAFVAYHDLRAAIRCHHTLGRELASMGLSIDQRPVIAHYSIMLNAANTPRDGILLVRDFQSASVTESDVQAVFSSYGQLKNVHRRMLASAGGAVIFLVEYYDLQDAKLAVFELSQSTPWGCGVRVEEAERPDKERQLGQQLLMTLHRWRAEQRATFPRISTFPGTVDDQADPHDTGATPSNGCFATSPQSAGSNLSPPQMMYFKAASYPGPAPGSNGGTPTLLYSNSNAGSYMSANAATQAAYAQLGLDATTMSPLDDATGLCGSFKGLWVSPHGIGSPSGKGRSPPGVHYPRRTGRGRDGMAAAAAMMGGGTPIGGGCSNGGGGGTGMEYQLDLDKVQKGLDKRTTIMIRNIPNKYTQALLLSEINVCHKGKYDFFYLPIDFKNKCNVGYAFINFIDYRAIIPFFKEFNGQRWKNFNSEKVCAISYARIQGKQSMISRFQNSSLMEKDGEYRPLLFHSAGMERGRPEPFPMGNKHGRRSGSTTPTGTCTSALLMSLGL